MIVSIHVAVAENGVIGKDGGLPWRLSTDLKRFKANTMGKPVVMGRATWAELGRPLPGRLNILVTRNRGYAAPDGVEIAGSLEDAITLATLRGRCMPGADEICIIGGGQIFKEAMPLVERLHITHVLARPEGDTFFPAIDPAVWEETSSQDVPAGEKDDFATRYAVYERRVAADRPNL